MSMHAMDNVQSDASSELRAIPRGMCVLGKISTVYVGPETFSMAKKNELQWQQFARLIFMVPLPLTCLLSRLITVTNWLHRTRLLPNSEPDLELHFKFIIYLSSTLKARMVHK
jgi:hypothetical protein